METRGTLCADENGMVFNDTEEASACDPDKFPNLERECDSQEEEVRIENWPGGVLKHLSHKRAMAISISGLRWL